MTSQSAETLRLLKVHIVWLQETSRNQLFDAHAFGKMIREAEERSERERKRKEMEFIEDVMR